MSHVLNRLVPFFALLVVALLPARGTTPAAPMFLTGTGGAYPDYTGYPFDNVPVGKTLVLPIAIRGTGPISYTVTSTSPAILPMIKTGYPSMTINVSYSGTTGPLSVLYPFTGGTDGGAPMAGLIQATDGNLYGVTGTDGASHHGAAFQLTTSGSLTTLYSFTGGKDGGNPEGALVEGTNGNLYGTTVAGGLPGNGTVFQLTTTGTLSTLHTFEGSIDGASPYGALVQGTNGSFFGTTASGGTYDHGTVFSVSADGSSFTTLHTFKGGALDGANPRGALVYATDGNLYGASVNGGTHSAGTLFRITTSGSFTLLHSFTGTGDANGGNPYGALIQGTNGYLYGTTETGGTSGFGTVFQSTTGGLVTTLCSFSKSSSGANPFGGVVEASDGNLYGTTLSDGTGGRGTVFQLSTSGSLATLYSFTGGATGGNPHAPLVAGTGGVLYGTATENGADSHGVVFQIPIPNAGAFSGSMKFALLRDMAPATCAYIAGFAQSGYYNGLDFFRITNLGSSDEPVFIAQGGDLTNTGTGSTGFTYNNEFHPSLIFTGEGQLAMANAGITQTTYQGTNDSQFFITQGPIRNLDFGYTIFGQLLTGFDVMQKVMSVPLESDSSTPVQKVVMNSVTVSDDGTDAILLVSAAGYGSATLNVAATDPYGSKAVVTSGTTSTPALSISISSYNDTFNDPPFIVPDPDVTTVLHQAVSFPVQAKDLEWDVLAPNAQALSFSGAGVTLNGNTVVVSPGSTPLGSVSVGLSVYQPYVSVERSSIYDQTAVNVGLGFGKLTSLPTLLSGTSAGPVVSGSAAVSGSAFASFTTSNPAATAADYTPLINWGDGTLTTSSNGATVKHSSSGLPTQFDVTYPAGHHYAKPGIYPVNVTVTDTDGGILQVQNTAVIASGSLYAFGQSVSAPAGNASGVIATFLDHTPGVTAANYGATINWGDGTVTRAAVGGSAGSFTVSGTHKYAYGTSYPVDVTINSPSTGHSGHAWGTATLSSLPTHQPPFAQSHITGQIGNPGYDGLYVDEEVVLYNSGDLASGPIQLRFFLSPDSNTLPINSAAVPLSVGGRATYNTPSIAPGGVIQGEVSQITLPKNALSLGRYLIMQIITPDPVANHMYYPKAAADPFPLLE